MLLMRGMVSWLLMLDVRYALGAKNLGCFGPAQVIFACLFGCILESSPKASQYFPENTLYDTGICVQGLPPPNPISNL